MSKNDSDQHYNRSPQRVLSFVSKNRNNINQDRDDRKSSSSNTFTNNNHSDSRTIIILDDSPRGTPNTVTNYEKNKANKKRDKIAKEIHITTSIAPKGKSNIRANKQIDAIESTRNVTVTMDDGTTKRPRRDKLSDRATNNYISPTRRARSPSTSYWKDLARRESLIYRRTSLSNDSRGRRYRSRSPYYYRRYSRSPSPLYRHRTRSPSYLYRRRTRSPSPRYRHCTRSPSPLYHRHSRSPPPLYHRHIRSPSPRYRRPTRYPSPRLQSRSPSRHSPSFYRPTYTRSPSVTYCRPRSTTYSPSPAYRCPSPPSPFYRHQLLIPKNVSNRGRSPTTRNRSRSSHHFKERNPAPKDKTSAINDQEMKSKKTSDLVNSELPILKSTNNRPLEPNNKGSSVVDKNQRSSSKSTIPSKAGVFTASYTATTNKNITTNSGKEQSTNDIYSSKLKAKNSSRIIIFKYIRDYIFGFNSFFK